MTLISRTGDKQETLTGSTAVRLTPPLTPDHQLKEAADGYYFYTFGITDIKA
jgi:hypothetical protein